MIHDFVIINSHIHDVNVIEIRIQQVGHPVQADKAVDRRRTVRPAVRQIGHLVNPAILYRVNGSPVGIAENGLIGVGGTLCDDDLRIPAENLFHGNSRLTETDLAST